MTGLATGSETGSQQKADAEGMAKARPDWRSPVRGAASRLREVSSGGRLVLAAGSVLAVITALWLTAGAWGGRIPSGDDTIPHLIRAEFAFEQLIPRGRIDGWAPSFILGYEAFLFSGPAFSWAVALVRMLSLGLLSVPGAFKVVFIGSFVVLPLTVAFLARSFGLDRRAAGVAAVLTLAVNNPFGGVGLGGLFGIGLATHQLGAIFFFLALGGALRVVHRPTPRWVVFTGVSLAILLASHGLSAFIFVVIFALVLAAMVMAPRPGLGSRDVAAMVRREVTERLRQLGISSTGTEQCDEAIPNEPTEAPTRLGLVSLALGFLLAGALAAVVIVPLVVHRDLQLMFTAWSTPPLGERIGHLWRGEILFRPGVAALVLAGLLYGLVRVKEGKPFAFALVAVPVAFLVVAHASMHLWPAHVLPTQLTTRGLGYLGVLAMLPLATLISWIGGRVGRLGGLAALGLALAIVIVPLGPWREAGRQINEPVPALREAAHQLAARVPDGARFATERELSDEAATTGLGQPHMWLAWASGRPTLNSYNPESSASPGAGYEADNIFSRPPEATASALARLGVSHLVTLSDEAADRLTASSRFQQVWRSSPVAIFVVSPDPGQPDPGALVTSETPVRAEMVEAEPEHMSIRIHAPQPAQVTVAVGWSPKWHASVNGAEVVLDKTADGLLQFDLPSGTSQVDLRFRPDVWNYVGLVITLVTVALLWGWFRRGRRARRALAGASGGRTEEPSARAADQDELVSDLPGPDAVLAEEEAAEAGHAQ